MTIRKTAWMLVLCAFGAVSLRGASGAADDIDRVVCTLDEDAIFLSEVERQARPFLAEIAGRNDMSAEQRTAARRQVLRQTLDRMVNESLIRRAATRAHTTVTSTEVDEFIERLAAERGATADQVYAALESEGITRSEYRARMETEVLTLKVLQTRVRGRVNFSDNDLRQEYQRLVREMPQRAVMHVAHILVEVPEGATDAVRGAARARAEEAARRAAAGEDWAALVRTFSSDTNTRDEGGDLGEVSQGTLPESLDTALEPLRNGQTSPAVLGPSGYHVLRLVDRRVEPPPPFEQVRQQVQGSLLQREMLRQQQIYLRELRRSVAVDDRLDPR